MPAPARDPVTAAALAPRLLDALRDPTRTERAPGPMPDDAAAVFCGHRSHISWTLDPSRIL